jgi:hypothetical protein
VLSFGDFLQGGMVLFSFLREQHPFSGGAGFIYNGKAANSDIYTKKQNNIKKDLNLKRLFSLWINIRIKETTIAGLYYGRQKIMIKRYWHRSKNNG